MENTDGISAFEIKASSGFNPDYYNHIRYFEKTFPQKVLYATIIYDGETTSEVPTSGLYNFRDAKLYERPLLIV